MSSRPRTEPRWSLTRRLAWRFAIMASALLALHALAAGWMLHEELQRELHAYLRHEVEEFALEITESRGPGGPQLITEEIASLTQPATTAFRVRAASGAILASSGDPALLAAGEGLRPSRLENLPSLLGTRLYLVSAPAGLTGMTAEVIVDAAGYHDRLLDALALSGLLLLISVLLAAWLAWFTTWRGLASLRDVALQVRGIGDAGGEDIRMHDAPAEFLALGADLNAMLERIRGGLREMRTFTAGLAHELRAPLQNLLGETEVALLAERSPEAYRAVLASHLEELHELSDAIDNLVAWCRSNDAAAQTPHRERFDLARAAELRLVREQRSAARAGIALELTTRGDTSLLADREASLRVVRNLVGNALAFSSAGGTVEVGIDGQADSVLLRVDDRGPGLPADLGDRVFLPFVTTRPRVGHRGGYGLGLAICRSIVEQHGGRIWHEPRAGGGTSFLAEFPRRPRGPRPAA